MDYLANARTVIELEIAELQRLQARLDQTFVDAVDLLRQALEERRKIIICGVGKSGNIAQKIAATLNSTGAPAVVLNSQDALHGDLGVVNEGDVTLLLSSPTAARRMKSSTSSPTSNASAVRSSPSLARPTPPSPATPASPWM